MRLRIIKYIRPYEPGEVVEIVDSVAREWITRGLAMQDKSMDGPSETKSETEKPRRKTAKRG
jgi:hypothetical protein